MSSYVLMKILESSPSRYDRGIRMLSLGKLDSIYDHLTSNISKGQRVLDIGCGTGALTLRAAHKGAIVKAIDINPGMIEIAEHHAGEAGLSGNIIFAEKGIAELDDEPPGSYDVVMSGLCFSELSNDEINYVLNELISKILKPGGVLLIADEVLPENIFLRILALLIRLPLVFITFLFTQTTTKTVKRLPARIEKAGFVIENINKAGMGNFITIVARRKKQQQKVTG